MVDASAVAATLVLDDESGVRATARLAADADQHAPTLLDLEVVATIRRRLFSAQLSVARADAAVIALTELPIERYPHVLFMPRIWELRHNVSPYDAAYVALAEVLGVRLVTADRRLADAPGTRCTIELLA